MYKTKSFYIESLGCAKNQVDSEILINSLLDLGWKQEEDPSVSSFIIVNTCGFIESAKQESIDVLISYRDAFPQSKIIATGCLSQRYPKELGSSMPNIDGILGNKNVTAISELIEKIYSTNTENPLVRLVNSNEISTHQIEKDETYSKTRKVLLSKRGSAYVKIAEGCNNNCSFCAIPLIRGRLKSRKIENIIEEIRNLTENGIKEINLIAQDLGSYGRDINKGKCLLANLLLEAEKIPGSFKIRMLYIHPDNFPLEIIPICAKNQVDSEILINSLLDLGWKQEEDPSVSSFIIVNTCGFIESAKQESIDVLISYRDAFPQSKIIATGCLSQRYPKELGSSMPNIDGILGNKNVTAISELIEKIYSTNTENPLVRLVNSNEISTHQIEKDETYSKTRKVLLSKRGSAYVFGGFSWKTQHEGSSNNSIGQTLFYRIYQIEIFLRISLPVHF